MATKDTNNLQPSSDASTRSRGSRGWLTGLLTLVVLATLLGTSAIVFATLPRQSATQQPPARGHWQQVLHDYALIALVAAPGDPSTLYACASPIQHKSIAGQRTILRSTDFGAHWQQLRIGLASNTSCQVAVNPVNANDLYVSGLDPANQETTVLQHSSDGGQTWHTVQASMTTPDAQVIHFQGNELSYVGTRLFAVQSLAPARPIELPTRAGDYLPHLISSSDGGRSWTVVDSRLPVTNLGVRSYAIDPSSSTTIYELLGPALLPFEQPALPSVAPFYGLAGQLYKTSDGGATWKKVLNVVSFDSRVQLATAHPHTIYVGGFAGPLPLDAANNTAMPGMFIGSFHMQISSDGGATWHQVATPRQAENLQNWFVDPTGLLYTAPGGGGRFSYGPPSTVETPSAPGATSGPPVDIPPVIMTPPTKAPPAVQSTPTPAVIQRYDPATRQWTAVTTSPAPGLLFVITPAEQNSGAVLWFIHLENNSALLYRFVA